MFDRRVLGSALVLVLSACNGAVDGEPAGPGSQDDEVAETHQALSAPSAGCSTVTVQTIADLRARIQVVRDLMQQDLDLCNARADTSVCVYLSYGIQNLATASSGVQGALDMFATEGFTVASVNGGAFVNAELVLNTVPALVRNELYILRSWTFSQSPNAPAAFERNMETIEAANDLMARSGRCGMGTTP
jgi:hypothetical protein